MSEVSFDEVLEAIEHLPMDQQADLLEVVRRRLAEAGRNRIKEEVAEARLDFANGNAKPANIDEIMREIGS